MKTLCYLLPLSLLAFSFVGCGKTAQIYIGAKNQMSSYSEKYFPLNPKSKVSFDADSCILEVYNWKSSQAKMEITRIVRSVRVKENLEKELKEFKMDMSSQDNSLSFKSRYHGNIKNPIDALVKVKLYTPRDVAGYDVYVGMGSIKFIDDINCNICTRMDMSDIEINKLSGRLNIEGNMGNIKVGSGKLMYGSNVLIKQSGNISISAEFEEEPGKYLLETAVGNIDVKTMPDSCVSFEGIGTVRLNEFKSKTPYPTIVKLKSGMGDIRIKCQ